MNYNTLAFLTGDDEENLITAVACIFSDTSRTLKEYHSKSRNELDPKTYTYKTTIKDLKEGDLVVVQCHGGSGNFGYAIAKVVEIDAEIDFQDQSINYRWIASKLNTDVIEATLEIEKTLIKQIKRKEKADKAGKMREILGITGKADLVSFRVENKKL